MKKLYVVAIFCIATLAFTNCGSKKGTGMSAAHVKIPKDAGAVIAMDMKLLQSKTKNIKEAMNSEMFKKLQLPADAVDMLKQVIEGVDTDQNMYFFTKVADQGSYMALSFMLKDIEKIKKVLAKAPTKPEFKAEGDMQLAIMEKGAIGYEGKTGLIMINESLKNAINRANGYQEEPELAEDEPTTDDEEPPTSMDDADEPKKESKSSRERERERKDIKRKQDILNRKKQEVKAKFMTESEFKATFAKVFKTSDSESLKTPSFIASQAANYDVSFWYNHEAIQKASMNYELESLIKNYPSMKEMMKMQGDSYAGVKFEKGEAVLETVSYIDQEAGKKYTDIISKADNDKLVRSIPIKTPTGILAFSLNMEAIYNLMKDDKKSTEGMEMGLSGMNLKPKDVFEMFDGNFVMASGSFDKDKLTTEPFGSVQAVLGVGLNKKDAFKKIMKSLVSDGMLSGKGKGVYQIKVPMSGGAKIFLVEKNNAFYITATTKLKDDLANGQGGLNITQTKGNTFSMFLDFKNIYAQIPAEVKKDKESKDAMDMFSQYKDCTMSMVPFKNGKTSSKFVLRFNDTSKNSLLVLSEMIEKAANSKMSRELSLR